jgi:hypothetical protein
MATPTASPSTVASVTLVMAPSPDGKHILVESFADPAHPVTLYSLSVTENNVKFISATEIGYTTNSRSDSPILGVTTIWRMSLNDMKPVSVAKVQGGTQDVAWSPDGSNVAYLAYSVASNQSVNRLWLKTGNASPRALTSLIELYGRGASSTDEVIVHFSPDGKYLLMVDTYFAGHAPKSPDQAHFQVRSVPDGKLVWAAPGALKGGWTTMAVWSHTSDRLLYDESIAVIQPFGVKTWDAPTKVVGTLAGGVIWHSPSVSADDRLVAYHVESTIDGKPHVEVRDLVSGSMRVMPGIFGGPLLLSNEVMLEVQFARNTQGVGPAYMATGKYFMLNLGTNVRTSLPARFRPIDVWPH